MFVCTLLYTLLNNPPAHIYVQRRCYSVRLSFTVTHLLFVMLLKLVLSEVNQVVTLLALMVTVLLSFSDNL